MTPEFARAVDPVFMYVLDLLERIGRDEDVTANEERLRIRARLDQAEAILGQGPEWQLAKYGLVSWIDEVLIEAPWRFREWWKDNSLEWEYFQSQIRSEEFYEKAKMTSTLRQKDALEVFYVCVVLGFRGLYRDPIRTAQEVGFRELPPDLETWAKQTALMIQLGRGRPPISEGAVPIEGAAPLDGPFAVLWFSVVGLALVVLNLIVGIVLYGS